MSEKNNISDSEGLCPICHHNMTKLKPRLYSCKQCQQDYYEEYICPLCEANLEQIKGCGSINYLCKKDGLVSSNKIKFHYCPKGK